MGRRPLVAFALVLVLGATRAEPEQILLTSSGAEWNFTRWAAATRGDVTSGRAQIREFSYNRPRTRMAT